MAAWPMGPYHGSVHAIPGYELRGLLGTSELTETYRGRGPKIQGKRSVALKLLRIDALPREHAALVAERFLSAGRFASSLSVPGMAAVLDSGDCEAGPYIATELVPGIDVAGLIGYVRKRNPNATGLPPTVASMLAAQVAEILATAHALSTPLYHHALSPGNIRITASAQVRVSDFGHASLLRGLGHPTGRWAFMAPELLRMRLPAVFEGNGAAADVYSLGILLYFLLTGSPPFEAASLAEPSAMATRPLPQSAGLPEQLVRTLKALTSPTCNERPTSAKEVVELLGGKTSAEERGRHIAGALAGLPIQWGKKVAPPPAQRKSALVARTRGPWSSVLAVGLVLIGAAAGIGIAAGILPSPFRRASPPKQQAPQATAGTTPSPPASMRLANLAETDVPIGPRIDGGIPADRVYLPMPKRPLPRVPNHLNLDTTPTGADIWVDGVLRGKTPVDLNLGPGGHRVVLLQEGQRMHKAVYDTTEGEWIRVPLQPPSATQRGHAQLSVACRSGNRLPIFIDDEDVGRLCPATNLRVLPGHHKVGVFVPLRRAIVETEVEALAGPKPTPVQVKD
jgi:serine/threonine protein kinase